MYPDGENYVVSPVVKSPTPLRRGKLVFKAINTSDF